MQIENTTRILPTRTELNELEYYANLVYNSQSLPKAFLDNAEKKETVIARVMMVFLKGFELKIPPLQALAQIDLINGSPLISGQTMLAIIFRDVPSAEIIFIEISSRKCVLKARRNASQEFTEFTYDIEGAKHAGLVSRSPNTWGKYPTQMLKWRAVSNMARTIFPDIIMGCYVKGEILPDSGQGSFGTMEDTTITPEVEKKLDQSIVIDSRSEIDDVFNIDDTFDTASFSTTELYSIASDGQADIGLKLDLPSVKEPKKTITLNKPKFNLQSTQTDSIKDNIIKTNVETKTESKKEKTTSFPSLANLNIVKPTMSSIKEKMNKITQDPEPKKTAGSFNFSLDLKEKPKVSKKEEEITLEPKSFLGPDFYNSTTIPDEMTIDFPWNLMKDIIEPVVNTADENVFNLTISRYYRNCLDISKSKKPIAKLLLDAYLQYCEVDLMKIPFDVEKEFYSQMDNIIKQIYSYLRSAEQNQPKKNLLNNILKHINLKSKYSEWLERFLISRDLIQINNGIVNIL